MRNRIMSVHFDEHLGDGLLQRKVRCEGLLLQGGRNVFENLHFDFGCRVVDTGGAGNGTSEVVASQLCSRQIIQNLWQLWVVVSNCGPKSQLACGFE